VNSQPKWVAEHLVDIINVVEDAPVDSQPELARAILKIALYNLVDVRNRNKVPLTRPKNLTILQVIELVESHFGQQFQKNAPRLPQVAMYAIYQCLVESTIRYSGMSLDPLRKMRAADRKTNTVGDIVLSKEGRPFEGVETKLGKAIGINEVTDAISKLKTASVERYFILSTNDIDPDEQQDVFRLCREFRASNGCEIIPNGLIPTLKYYLRLLDSPTSFVDKYASLVESDSELDYEHRLAWNEICALSTA
jgi:DNA (cytosine-5)-methyltransferase 1